MTGDARIRLAIVDDSSFVRKAITRICEREEDVEVVGIASSGEELLAHLETWQPNAVTLDLSMPGIGGMTTLERILQWKRIPVLVLSAHSRRQAPLALEALSRGAIDFVDKEQFSLVDFESLRNVLLPKLRSALDSDSHLHAEERTPPVERHFMQPLPLAPFDLLLIGASTGGPPAIERILLELGADFPLPVAVVQHMPSGFTAVFADRLDRHVPIRVMEATHGLALTSGMAVIAPAGIHLKVRREGNVLVTALSRYPETSHRPAVDILFHSAVPFARNAVALLLTGMGEDGAQGMLALAEAGAFTIAQDEASSVVYGMPRAAAVLGAPREQLPLQDIASRLRELARPSELAESSVAALPFSGPSLLAASAAQPRSRARPWPRRR